MLRYGKILLFVTFAVVIGATSVTVQKRSTALTALDYMEIQQLYARYNWTIDSGDAEGWAAVFTPDGVFQLPAARIEGRDPLVKWAAQFVADPKRGARMRHWNTNLLISPTADGARGQVYLSSLDFTATPPTVLNSSAYYDDLVKTPQGWRFAKRAVLRVLLIDEKAINAALQE